MDVFTPDKRSEVMSHIRSGDTKPELFVRRLLFAADRQHLAQALRLARTCTLSGLTPDQALDAAARLLEESPSAGKAAQ